MTIHQNVCDWSTAPTVINTVLREWHMDQPSSALCNRKRHREQTRTSMSADRISDTLFFDGLRPDVAAIFRKMFITRHYNDHRWWNAMLRHTRFDPDIATFHPII